MLINGSSNPFLFQHTAARRRLQNVYNKPDNYNGGFQHTAARRRLRKACSLWSNARQCFNTQPPEGGCHFSARSPTTIFCVSTHSRPKAAACCFAILRPFVVVSTHSRPKAAAKPTALFIPCHMFQHTAARRRLPVVSPSCAPL